MNTFIESVVSHDKSEYTDKRHLLVCDCCYWCSSYLPDIMKMIIMIIFIIALFVMRR